MTGLKDSAEKIISITKFGCVVLYFEYISNHEVQLCQ